jgi:alpha-galactosidase
MSGLFEQGRPGPVIGTDVHTAGSRWLSLRQRDVMVVVDVGGPYLPRVVYWGADLGDLTDEETSALPLAVEQERGPRPADGGVPFTLSPSRAQGWRGWPGLSGHRGGVSSQPLFSLEGFSTEARDGGHALLYRGADPLARLVLDGELELTVDGVMKLRQTLSSTASAQEAGFEVEDLITLLPVPEDTAEALDF